MQHCLKKAKCFGFSSHSQAEVRTDITVLNTLICWTVQTRKACTNFSSQHAQVRSFPLSTISHCPSSCFPEAGKKNVAERKGWWGGQELFCLFVWWWFLFCFVVLLLGWWPAVPALCRLICMLFSPENLCFKSVSVSVVMSSAIHCYSVVEGLFACAELLCILAETCLKNGLGSDSSEVTPPVCWRLMMFSLPEVI